MDQKVVPFTYSSCESKNRSPLQDISANHPPSKRRRQNVKRSPITTAANGIENVAISDDDFENVPKDRWAVEDRVPSEILEDMGVSYLDDESPHTSFTSLVPPSPPRASRKFCKGQKREIPSLGGTPQRTITAAFALCKRNTRQELNNGKDPFMDLSDEMILDVFKWLPKTVLASCGRVCKRWMRLAFDESLWRRIDLTQKHISPGVLGNVLNRGVVVLRLAMASVKAPVFGDTPLLCCPADRSWGVSKVQYLDLSMASIEVSALSELLGSCSQLKKLSLEQCPLDDHICRLIGANRDLESLNMCMTKGFTHAGITHITRGCTSLTSWNLAWSGMTTASLDTLVLTVTPKLRKLNISGCRTELSNDHVLELVKQCPRLVELDLSDAAEVSCDALRAIAKGLPNLQLLAVSRCYNIVPATYLVLSQMECLQHLEVFGLLTDAALQSLRSRLPHVDINKQLFSTIARPTTGVRISSIWGLRVRD
ncbi:S-phase kinase-associated protein 2-like [Haemaphysalis longicornis]